MKTLPFLMTLILIYSCRSSLYKADFNYEQWQMDSLGNSGLRDSLINSGTDLYKLIKHQNVDSVKFYLGEPNSIDRETNGPKYQYFIYFLDDCDNSDTPTRPILRIGFERNLVYETMITEYKCRNTDHLP